MTPTMSLARYLELASRLPRPTLEQAQAFVTHLCTDHSWYKHLPILPPGKPFHVFLDPGAGMTRVGRPDGQFSVQARSDAERYHHAWFSTDKTRARFGYLSYAVSYPGEDVADHDRPSLLDPDLGIDVLAPQEVLAAAQTPVSGLIHPLGTDHGIILLQSSHRAAAWPADSGGPEHGQKILARCRALASREASRTPAPEDAELDDETQWALKFGDWTLHQLLTPERLRQRDGLLQAAQRAIAFAQGA
jgi:hypothetical protein